MLYRAGGELPSWVEDCGVEDLHIMSRALKQLKEGATQINVGESGTAARILLAHCALAEKHTIVLSACGRLPQRPIEPLLLYLRELGAQVRGNRGALYAPQWPLTIEPGYISTEGMPSLCTPSSDSSQFVTALLLQAPYLPHGLLLRRAMESVSVRYIDLTLRCMQLAGAKFEIEGADIRVFPGQYDRAQLEELCSQPQGDWSSAQYIFQWIALSPPGTSIRVSGLQFDSSQPDEAIANLMKEVGVDSQSVGNGQVEIRKEPFTPWKKERHYCLNNTPDLVPTWVVTLLALGCPFQISGVEHLRHKESNRIEALLEHARAGGYPLSFINGSFVSYLEKENSATTYPSSPTDVTYFRQKSVILPPLFVVDPRGDHRTAMSWAPVALTGRQVRVNESHVVRKSFSSYWHLWKMYTQQCLSSPPQIELKDVEDARETIG